MPPAKGSTWISKVNGMPHRRVLIRSYERRGNNLLTRSEERIALLSFMSDKEIAEILELTTGTVKTYMHRIRQTLGLPGRVDLSGYLKDGCSGEEFTLP